VIIPWMTTPCSAVVKPLTQLHDLPALTVFASRRHCSGRRTSDLSPTPEADGEGDGVAASVGDGVGVDGAEVDCREKLEPRE
jgi:hypothetical protein